MPNEHWTAGRAGSASAPEGLIRELSMLSRIPRVEWLQSVIPANIKIAMMFANGNIGFAETAGEAPFEVYSEIALHYGHNMIGWLPR